MARILYAEDEVFLGQIVKESLESRGFEVHMIADGAEVAEAANRLQPDLCVLDVMMPNRDGFENAKLIRQQHPQLPILFLTAKTQTDDVLQGFKQGGNDYIKKPFSMEELIVRITNLLQLSGQAVQTGEQENIAIGNFTYNLPRQLLKLGDEEKKLSHRESELLLYLYNNRNTIVDRRELLQALWGNDNFFNSRNLDVYVTRLRGMLKPDEKIEILTIKGIGYRFVV